MCNILKLFQLSLDTLCILCGSGFLGNPQNFQAGCEGKWAKTQILFFANQSMPRENKCKSLLHFKGIFLFFHSGRITQNRVILNNVVLGKLIVQKLCIQIFEHVTLNLWCRPEEQTLTKPFALCGINCGINWSYKLCVFLLRAYTNWRPKGAMEKGAGTHAKGIFNSCPGGTQCQERDLPNKAAAFWTSPRRISTIAQNVWGWQPFLCELWVYRPFLDLSWIHKTIYGVRKCFHCHIFLSLKALKTEVRHSPLSLLFRAFGFLLGLLEYNFLTWNRNILVAAILMLHERQQRWKASHPLSLLSSRLFYTETVILSEAFCRPVVSVLA